MGIEMFGEGFGFVCHVHGEIQGVEQYLHVQLGNYSGQEISSANWDFGPCRSCERRIYLAMWISWGLLGCAVMRY